MKRSISLPVEAVVWRDASRTNRGIFVLKPVILVSYGALIHEDKDQVVLAQEHTWDDGWAGNEMDYVVIPRSLVKKRISIGQAEIPLSSRKE